jgi:Flp pilus assembly protein TadG
MTSSRPSRELTTRARRAADGGAVTVQLVIATPVLLLILMLIVQAGLWMHATHTAQAAAGRAVEATRALDGTEADGREAAQHTLGALTGASLHDVRITVTRTATTSRVYITGTAESVVPGVRWRVQATAEGANERFVPGNGP